MDLLWIIGLAVACYLLAKRVSWYVISNEWEEGHDE